MLKLKNSAMLVVAVLCGYLALMTPDWKSDLVAASGVAYLNDQNGDTRADILLRNTATGDWDLATMNGLTVLNEGAVGALTDIENVIVSTGDFDGDGDADILTRGTANGIIPYAFRVELTTGTAVDNSAFLTTMSMDPNDVVMSTKDFNYDSRADVLLRNSTTGAWTMNYMDGVNDPSIGTVNALTDTCYTMKGDGDYYGNLVPDILLRKDACGGATYPWYMATMKGDFNVYQTGTVPTMSMNIAYGAVVTDKDFNGDGRDDVLIRQTSGSPQQWVEYELGGVGAPLSFGAMPMAVQSMWQMSTSADFNGDGKEDVMLRSVDTGQFFAYLFNGRTATSSAVINMAFNPIYVVQTIDDFNGDGKQDILLRNSASGVWLEYLMNGLTIASSSTSLPIVTDTGYTLQND